VTARVSADFAGVWSGYWIEPQKVEAKLAQLSSRRVSAKLSVGTDSLAVLHGEMRIGPRVFRLQNAKGQTSHLVGQWVEVKPSGSAVVPEILNFVADISQTKQRASGAHVWILELRIPKSVSTLVLRRDDE